MHSPPMSSYSFWSSISSGNANSDDVFFDVSDYLALNDEGQEDPAVLPTDLHRHCPVLSAEGDAGGGAAQVLNGQIGRGNVEITSEMSVDIRVAIRTKTELEILDDGYKWRKYGKKKVKSSPNPRNYFKCSSNGCLVKKRVEREREDSSYLVTTYEGIHNHPAPSLTVIPRLPSSVDSYHGC